MKTIRNYSLFRLVIVGFGVGVAVFALRWVTGLVVLSSWSKPVINGIIVGLVVAFVIAYFGTGDRKKMLFSKEKKDSD